MRESSEVDRGPDRDFISSHLSTEMQTYPQNRSSAA